MATPNIHLGESFLDRLIKDTYGKNSLGELSTEQMNELDAYMKSDDFKTKSQNFRSTDKTKFEGSVDHFLGKDTEKSKTYLQSLSNPDQTKYLIPRSTTATTVTDPSNTTGSTVRPSVDDGSTEKVVRKQPVTNQWLEIAKSNGFTSLDDVKAFQKKVGLDQTGQLDESALAKLAWYNHMKGLNYSEKPLQNGQVYFSNEGTSYFNNGRMQSSNGTMSDYDYKTLTIKPPSSAIPTLSDLFKSKYFRKHYNYAGNTVKIGDAEYPLVVTKGLAGNGLNVTDDHSYVFDPSTGKIRKLRETWTGNIQAFRGPEFEKNSTWIDVQPILDYKPQPKPQPTTSYNVGGRQSYLKQGGTMNRIKYFEKGGLTQQQRTQDIQQQVVALVQAAMQGDEKANQTVTQIMEAAKAGDQQATQLAQMIQAVVKQMQGQATSAKWGSKLGYIKSLKYAQGGKTCPACEKGAPVKVEEKACGGKAKKAKKRYFGGWL